MATVQNLRFGTPRQSFQAWATVVCFLGATGGHGEPACQSPELSHRDSSKKASWRRMEAPRSEAVRITENQEPEGGQQGQEGSYCHGGQCRGETTSVRVCRNTQRPLRERVGGRERARASCEATARQRQLHLIPDVYSGLTLSLPPLHFCRGVSGHLS